MAMAFFSKIGRINAELSLLKSKACIFQAERCFSSVPSSKLFIGGIPYSTNEQQLRENFGKCGQVIDARIIVDRESGRSRGFGFITYTNSEEASCAIQALDGQPLHGRNIKVSYASDRALGGGGYNRGFGSPSEGRANDVNYTGDAGYGGNATGADTY